MAKIELPVNIFDTYNKMMPNNIVDRFGKPKPIDIKESDDFLWEEGNYYNLTAEYDNKKGEFFFDNKALIEPGKYLYLNKQNHESYLKDKENLINTGARFTFEDGKEYLYYDDDYVYTDENDAYGKEVIDNTVESTLYDGLDNFVDDASTITEEEESLFGDKNKSVREVSENITLNQEVGYIVKGVTNRIKRHFVGDASDLGRINAEMLGTSNVNLGVKLITQNLPGGNWELEGAASLEEALSNANSRDDYTIYEKIAEQVLGIIYDSPTIAIATYAAMNTPGFRNSTMVGFTVGFVNSSIKESLIVSLQRGDVNSFDEWKQVWLHKGITEGLKSGFHLGTAMTLGSGIGAVIPKTFFSQLAAQVIGFELSSMIVLGEDLNIEKAIVTSGTFGVLGALISPLKTAKSLFRVVDKHRLISEKGQWIKEELARGNTVDKIAKDMGIDPSIIQDLKSFDGTLEGVRAYNKPGKVEFDIQNSFESYKNPEKIAREQKILEQQRANLEKLGEKLKGDKPERFEFKKLTKEQIKEKLESELEKLKKDKDYIPEEYGYEVELLLTSAEQRAKFNKQLQSEIKDMLRDNYKTIPEKIQSTVKSFKDIVDKAVKKQYDAHAKEFYRRLIKSRINGIEKSPIDYLEGFAKDPKINSKLTPFENIMVWWFDKLFPFQQISNRIIIENEKMKRKSRLQGKTPWIDYNPLLETMKIEKILKNTLTGAKAMQVATGAHTQIAVSWVTAHQLNKNGAKIGVSLEEIVGDLDHTKIDAKGQSEFTRFEQYLVARRAIQEYRLNPKAKDGSFYYTLEEARSIANQHEKSITRTGKFSNDKSKFKEKAELLDKYQDNLLQYLVDSEVMTAKQANAFRKLNKNYTPWFLKTDYLNSGQINLKDFKINDPIKQMANNIDKKISSPIESIYKNTFTFIEIGENNAALRRFINELTEHRVRMVEYNKAGNILTGEKYIELEPTKAWIKDSKKEISKNIEIETDPSYLPEIYRTSTTLEKIAIKEAGTEKQKARIKKEIELEESIKNEESIISELLTNEMYAKGLGDFNALFEPLNTKKLGRDQLLVYNKGVAELWNMPEYLSNSLKQNHTLTAFLNRSLQNVPVIKHLSGGLKVAARTMRKGVTTDPRFLWNVFIKDSQLTTINSNNLAWPLYQVVVGTFTMLGKNKTLGTSFARKDWQVHYRRWMRTGGPSSIVEIDKAFGRQGLVEKIQEIPKLNEAVTGNEKLVLIRNMQMRFVRAKEKVKSTLDNIYFGQESPNRLGEYILNQTAIRKNLKTFPISRQDAIKLSVYESRNLIDFSKSGILGEIVNQHSGFFNASLQGTSKIGEIFGQGTPGKRFNFSQMAKRLTLTLGIQSIPTAMLWFINHDDPVYRRQSTWLKNLYWLIPIKDEDGKTLSFVPIARGWEQGLLFATTVEKMLDWIYDYDEEGYLNFVDEVTRTYLRATAPRVLGFGQAFGEVVFNKSIYTGNPIIPAKQNDLSKNLQGNINSNPLSKKASELAAGLTKYSEESSTVNPAGFAAGVVGALIPGTQKIDHLARNFFGTVWKYKSGILNQLIRQHSLKVDAPLPDFSNYWDAFLDSLLFDTFSITTSYTKSDGDIGRKIEMTSEPITEMYKIWNEDFIPLQMKLKRLNELYGEGNKEADKLLESPEYEGYMALQEIMQNVYLVLTEYKIYEQMSASENVDVKKGTSMEASDKFFDNETGKQITDKKEIFKKQVLDRRLRMDEMAEEIYIISVEFHEILAEMSGTKNKYSVIESDYDHIDQLIQKTNKTLGLDLKVGPSYSEKIKNRQDESGVYKNIDQFIEE